MGEAQVGSKWDWVLHYGSWVEVLEPPELWERVAKEHNKGNEGVYERLTLAMVWSLEQ